MEGYQGTEAGADGHAPSYAPPTRLSRADNTMGATGRQHIAHRSDANLRKEDAAVFPAAPLTPDDSARSRSVSAPVDHSMPKSTSRELPGTSTGGLQLGHEGVDPLENTQKLSPAQILALTLDPESLPVRAMTPDYVLQDVPPDKLNTIAELHAQALDSLKITSPATAPLDHTTTIPPSPSAYRDVRRQTDLRRAAEKTKNFDMASDIPITRPAFTSRTLSTPASAQRSRPLLDNPADVLGRAANANGAANYNEKKSSERSRRHKQSDPGPPVDSREGTLSNMLPLPPLSLPTYLDLELSTDRPSQLYIRRESSSDAFYESTRVKMERLRNFLVLPAQLENVLFFGALTCLDAWLYTFTILPIRFVRAAWIYFDWLSHNALGESRDIGVYVCSGLGRLRRRYRRRKSTPAPPQTPADGTSTPSRKDSSAAKRSSTAQRPAESRRSSTVQTKALANTHRNRSKPSLLNAEHKSDLLQGLLIFLSCLVLMRFDASRMYHAIRGQSAIKLYVIYNVLEVFDRLFSALGQDILECLFSDEMLERNSHGRSRVFQPFWMFILALIYTICHATALFYQVVTLNVAVNSYSNALLTLLMSNQFVEIKGTVFKKFEKESLFQITCADVVERFQLWLMLLVIALRNIVEVGGLSITTSSSGSSTGTSSGAAANESNSSSFGSFNILPASFTLLPSVPVLQVLSPFLIVLASEMLVDWLKHAYITKFNATSPKIYGRFFDILAKDYYANAFSPPFASVTKRLGLPIIPLACLFIRAAVQTYHMFLATNISSSSAFTMSSSTSLATQADTVGTAQESLFDQFIAMFQRALGHSSLGGGLGGVASRWSLDDGIALLTMLVFFLAVYLILLAFKLVLGMVLLQAARARYSSMQAREREKSKHSMTVPDTKRVSGWGSVAIGEDRRKIIYDGDDEGLAKARERDAKTLKAAEAAEGKGQTLGLEGVQRYSMVAKRIW